jgi:hypothetical protein
MANVPTLTITFDTPLPQVGPGPGVPINLTGKYTVSAQSINILSTTVSLQLNPLLAFQYTEPVTFNNGVWVSASTTHFGGPIKATVTLAVTYGPSSFGAQTVTATATQTLSATTSNVQLQITAYQQSPFAENGVPIWGAGSTVNVNGTASSESVLRTVKTLSWQVADYFSGSELVSGGASGPPPFSTWTASISLPPGQWTIVFTATDDGTPNPDSTTQKLDVEVAVPVDVFDVAPVSYLQALIEFATQPTTYPASPGIDFATISDLEGALAQPISVLQLQELTSRVNGPVHQLRACIEVLRRYPHWTSDFQASEETAYRRAAYEAVLLQLGTSFREIRLARSYGPADQDRRRALADRLGIDLGATRPDSLDLLILDPSVPSSQPNALTELALEQLFGLVDTTRLALSGGLTLPPVQTDLWTLAGVRWGINTDRNGVVWCSIQPSSLGASSFQADLYFVSPTGAHVFVASGSGTNKVALYSSNNSGLTGTLWISSPPGLSSTCQLQVVPRFLSWQLEHLRTRWAAEDFSATAPGAWPIVDPDLLTRGDFVNPASNGAYNLYLGRQAAVQAWLAALQHAQATSLDSVIQTGIGKKAADLLGLDAQLQSGQDISAQLATINLSFEAFEYLVRICNLAPQGQQLLTADWDDVFSILIQAQKQGQYAAWRNAEQTAGLTLGPDFFTAPPRLPDLFATGVDQTGSLLTGGTVDPQWTYSTPGGPSLPTYATATQPAVWLANSATSRWISPQANESTGDAPGVYLYSTQIDLSGYDPTTVKLTLQVAVDNGLVAVKLNGQAVPGLSASGFSAYTSLTINDGFLPGVNTLLFFVNNLGTSPNPSGLRVEFSFFSPPSPAVPDRWRAPAATRAAWRATLEGRIAQQQHVVEQLQNAVLAAEEETLPLLRNALVNSAIRYLPFDGLCPTGVDVSGVPIPEGSAQASWKITANPSGPTSANAFVTQNRYSGWVPNSSTALWISPSASESPGDRPGAYTYETDFLQGNWSGVAPVQLTANVSADDTITAIRLNGANVNLPAGIGFAAPTPITISGFVPGPNKLEFVVNNAGAANNPTGLRVEFPFGLTTVDQEWLAQRLLIDLDASPTQMTTRLTLAIESMQGLLSALRDFAFQQMLPQPDLTLWRINNLASFDLFWRWTGTYATWRATMLAFLYPENLLFPSLLFGSHWNPTNAFQTFILSLRAASSITRQGAVAAAGHYLASLRSTTDSSGNPISLPSGIPLNYEDPSNVDLSLRRTTTQGLLTPLPADLASLTMYWEVFFFVPVQLALQLQRAGQYEAALDWFRTVYDIDKPVTQTGGQWSDDARKVFYGLSTERSANPQFIRVPGSLEEDSNPHDVAVTRVDPYTRFVLQSIVSCMLDLADSQFTRETAESVSNARELYLEGLSLLNELEEMISIVPGLGVNPQITALRQRAENNLAKMQSNRNIAGLLLQFDLFGRKGEEVLADRRASLDPTQYHYATLIDRAKQLGTLAQQVETTYLGVLASADNETYNLMKAQGDLNVANATVTLLTDQVTEATDGVTVANDQAARANDEQTHYQNLIDGGLSDHEKEALGEQLDQFRFGIGASITGGIGPVLQGASIGAEVGGPWGAVVGGIIGAAGPVFSGLSTGSGQHAQFSAAEASYERRKQEWGFQLQLAGDDVATTSAQIKVANDHVTVVKDSQAIATTQQTNAQDIVNFLANKFTNADLYDWMSGVLGHVYRFYLQQATSVARLAEDQLAFERQQPALSVIQPEYWIPLSDLSADGSTSSDRRGLTGAERLLADITQLDQYAFQTDRRKLQLTKTISLSQLDPFAFQRFRETGVLMFSTSEYLFDQDFPGHYVRLISAVRTSVVALVPPTVGIRATLSNKGVSRVVAGVPSFRQVIVQRDPEVVALSSPFNASGVFELDPQSQLLRPFENLGVDTTWGFEMPKAANPFDYHSIADVLFSIDYTALYSPSYRNQVLQQLDPSVSADLGYSFVQDFPDAWYDLNNADPTVTTVTVSFSTLPADFPPNVESLAIAQVVLYFARADGAAFEVQVSDFQFTPLGALAALDGGAAVSENAVISTRRSNGSGWKAKFVRFSPFGQWQLTLPNTAQTQAWFANKQIEDILFVITYGGIRPAWPD